MQDNTTNVEIDFGFYDARVEHYVNNVLRCWIPDVEKLGQLWLECYNEAGDDPKSPITEPPLQRQALWLLINKLMNDVTKALSDLPAYLSHI